MILRQAIKAYRTKLDGRYLSLNELILNPQKDSKNVLTLLQFWMAEDLGLGTHSPVEHPYPLCCIFPNRSKVLQRSWSIFNHNLYRHTAAIPLYQEEIVSPKSDSVAAAKASLFPCVWACLTHTLYHPQGLHSGALVPQWS